MTDSLERQIEEYSSPAFAYGSAQYVRFGNRLLEAFEDEHCEPGEIMPSERIVEEAIAEYGPGTVMGYLGLICLDWREFPAIISDVLHILSHLPWDTVNSGGVQIAERALRSSNDTVCEFALKAFENWEQPETAELLEHVRYRSEVLEQIRHQVIRDLRGM